MLMSDNWIIQASAEQNMIEPFIDRQISTDNSGRKVLSYGVSSYGYDTRISDEFQIFTNVNNTVIDPKNFGNDIFVTKNSDSCVIPPNSFVLAKSVEYFKIPQNILVICVGKSTYARCGIIVNVTPIEPGWEGYITLEFSNTTPLPAKIYANEGACQLLFFKGIDQCNISYSQRNGKYMYQRGITKPYI
ncbi:dCTP deaminase [Rickettsia endosymbiont of Cardiosporidium cionae]|uniref:dCTP deaminase n=1 Tax=Rickettsia endosymbiont of Cardiosporidium cionae TaxID=2777155 RepID=UPI001895B77D|nr:dCTP deaminase [Rickettsia endosymbiont of Cardiosporidium cionae]KAF8818121.1 dCTP deaminase [Rickettsia endosymbiont of Cardiosporidium cionae]